MKKWLAGIAASVIAGIIVAVIIIVVPNGNGENGRCILSIAVTPHGGGTVVLNPPQLAGGYEEGTTVTLIAEHSEGYVFDEWTGDASGSDSTTTVKMSSSKSATAIFYEEPPEPPGQYPLSVSVIPQGSGTVTLSPSQPAGGYEEGTFVTLMAQAFTGYDFDEWGGDASGGDGTTTVKMSSSKNATAIFYEEPPEPPGQYPLSVSVIPQGSGTVTLSPPQPAGGYEEGTFVTLIANASTGCEFDEWTGDASGASSPTALTMDSRKTATANFKGTASILGTIYYGLKRDGVESVAEYTNADAELWLYETNSMQRLTPDYDYDTQTGEFVIHGVPPGKYELFGRVESGYPFDTFSPGDFDSQLTGYPGEVVVTPTSSIVDGDLQVTQRIHVTLPYDNQDFRDRGDFPLKLYHYQSGYGPSAKTFGWEAVPGATVYRVSFSLHDANGNLIDTLYLSPTSNSCSPNLEVTSGGSYYRFYITAYKDSKLVGALSTFYGDGSRGGGFEFTVAPRP